MPWIIVTRDRDGMDMLRSYKLLLDGSEIGRVKRGRSLEFEVTPKNHELTGRIDWCTTPPIAVDASKGDARFRIRSNIRGWKQFFPLLYLFTPSQWISLERLDESAE